MGVQGEVKSTISLDGEYYLHFKVFSKAIIAQLIQTYGKEKLLQLIEEESHGS